MADKRGRYYWVRDLKRIRKRGGLVGSMANSVIDLLRDFYSLRDEDGEYMCEESHRERVFRAMDGR